MLFNYLFLIISSRDVCIPGGQDQSDFCHSFWTDAVSVKPFSSVLVRCRRVAKPGTLILQLSVSAFAISGCHRNTKREQNPGVKNRCGFFTMDIIL